MADLFVALLNANLALAAAVAVVMAVRLPVRRVFGARAAYGLWIVPPMTALAMLVPTRVVTVVVPSLPAEARTIEQEALADPALLAGGAVDPRVLILTLWLVGALASLAWLAWRQVQFARAARAGRAGPAVVGVLRPRIVIPSDFDDRYTPREREVVLAHEETHLARRDPPVNALLALVTCVSWFNPAVHVMSRWLRIDQELACDARVVAAYPKARKAYAEAMLKTQLAARPLPLGCHWSAHPLAQRVRLLSRPAPSRARRLTGIGLALAMAGAGAGMVWTSRPPEVVLSVEAAAPIAPPSPRRAPTAPAPPDAPRPASRPPAPTPQTAPVAVAKPAPDMEPVLLPALAVAEILPPLPPPGLRKLKIIHAVADRSAVEPGSAVRVQASGVAPDGVPLWADFTAFGSQRIYRKGAYEKGESRYSLFTSVVQEGERLRVTVSFGREFRPHLTGSIDLLPGHTGVVTLPTGQDIVVTATVRPETPDEIEEGRQLMAYRDTLQRLRPGFPERIERPEQG